jgi:hypothetical protein
MHDKRLISLRKALPAEMLESLYPGQFFNQFPSVIVNAGLTG